MFCFSICRRDCQAIANAVKEKYPETFFVMNEKGEILDILGRNEVKDTLINGNRIWVRNKGYEEKEIIRLYDYERLDLLMDEINRMIEASVPQINFYNKSIKVKENFLDSEVFKANIKEFKYFLKTLVEIVFVIKSQDSLFLPQYEPLKNVADLQSWQEWEGAVGSNLDIGHFICQCVRLLRPALFAKERCRNDTPSPLRFGSGQA